MKITANGKNGKFGSTLEEFFKKLEANEKEEKTAAAPEFQQVGPTENMGTDIQGRWKKNPWGLKQPQVGVQQNAQPAAQAPAQISAPAQAPAKQPVNTQTLMEQQKQTDQQRAQQQQSQQNFNMTAEIQKVVKIMDQFAASPFAQKNKEMSAMTGKARNSVLELMQGKKNPAEVDKDLEEFSTAFSGMQAQWNQAHQRGQQFIQQAWQQINAFRQFISKAKK